MWWIIQEARNLHLLSVQFHGGYYQIFSTSVLTEQQNQIFMYWLSKRSLRAINMILLHVLVIQFAVISTCLSVGIKWCHLWWVLSLFLELLPIFCDTNFDTMLYWWCHFIALDEYYLELLSISTILGSQESKLVPVQVEELNLEYQTYTGSGPHWYGSKPYLYLTIHNEFQKEEK